MSCGDKISSCRRQVQVENLHPHGKTCTHNSKNPGSEPVEDQMPVSLVATRFHLVSCRISKLKTCCHNSNFPSPPLFVATRFHLVGEVQVENSHPHGKTCSHNSKKPGSEPAEDQMPVCLVATRFHRVDSASWKTCTHMEKLAARFGDGTKADTVSESSSDC